MRTEIIYLAKLELISSFCNTIKDYEYLEDAYPVLDWLAEDAQRLSRVIADSFPAKERLSILSRALTLVDSVMSIKKETEPLVEKLRKEIPNLDEHVASAEHRVPANLYLAYAITFLVEDMRVSKKYTEEIDGLIEGAHTLNKLCYNKLLAQGMGKEDDTVIELAEVFVQKINLSIDKHANNLHNTGYSMKVIKQHVDEELAKQSVSTTTRRAYESKQLAGMCSPSVMAFLGRN